MELALFASANVMSGSGVDPSCIKAIFYHMVCMEVTRGFSDSEFI